MSKSKRRRPKKTARIHYGPESDPTSLYWTVIVRDATRAVKVNGNLADAMSGTPGTTIGCHLSRCVKRNHLAFGHACYLAAFTQTTCLIVTRVKNGKPTHAIRYAHSCGDLVNLNDKDPRKVYLKEHPEIAARSFTLRPPTQQKQRRGSPPQHMRTVNPEAKGTKSAAVPKGALKRAIDAGLITSGLEHLSAA